jgi:methionyl-tRNA formyltransferase
MDKSVNLINLLLLDAEAGSIPRIAQPIDAGSYYSSITSKDYQLCWDWSAEKIRRNIIITPGKCYIDICGQPIFFHDAETEHMAHPAAPGTLLQLRRKWAAVATSQGAISSSRINLSGKVGETFAGFCRRVDFKPGDKLTERSEPAHAVDTI